MRGKWKELLHTIGECTMRACIFMGAMYDPRRFEEISDILILSERRKEEG